TQLLAWRIYRVPQVRSIASRARQHPPYADGLPFLKLEAAPHLACGPHAGVCAVTKPRIPSKHIGTCSTRVDVLMAGSFIFYSAKYSVIYYSRPRTGFTPEIGLSALPNFTETRHLLRLVSYFGSFASTHEK